MPTSSPPTYPPPQPPYGGGPPSYPYGEPAFGPLSRTSGTAVTGFVLSLLLCIPFVSGLGGLIFGLVGLNATGKPNVRGRGLAVAAVVIGAVGLLGWGLAFAVVVPNAVAGFKLGFASSTEGPAFARALAVGNVSAAAAYCVPGTAAVDLQQTSDELQAFGTLQSARGSRFAINPPGQIKIGTADMVMTYPTGSKILHLTLERQADDTVKITKWQLR